MKVGGGTWPLFPPVPTSMILNYSKSSKHSLCNVSVVNKNEHLLVIHTGGDITIRIKKEPVSLSFIKKNNIPEYREGCAIYS